MAQIWSQVVVSFAKHKDWEQEKQLAWLCPNSFKSSFISPLREPSFLHVCLRIFEICSNEKQCDRGVYLKASHEQVFLMMCPLHLHIANLHEVRCDNVR